MKYSVMFISMPEWQTGYTEVVKSFDDAEDALKYRDELNRDVTFACDWYEVTVDLESNSDN